MTLLKPFDVEFRIRSNAEVGTGNKDRPYPKSELRAVPSLNTPSGPSILNEKHARLEDFYMVTPVRPWKAEKDLGLKH